MRNEKSKPFAICLLISPKAYMQVRSESYGAALNVYNYAKNSPAGFALEGVAEDLGRRFARKPRPTELKQTGNKNSF